MRTRRKILISILVAVVIVAVVAAAFLTGVIVIQRATKLTISPSSFTVESGSSIILTARIESDSFILSGKTITWSASEGSLDKTVGDSVMYTAPVVTGNTSVTITASFGGDRNYWGSSTTINGLVIPRKATPTTLSITPSTFEVLSNGSVTLTAILIPTSAPSQMITWSVDGPGTLSPTTGPSVTYNAPKVEEDTPVEITATFPGTTEYSTSTATCSGVLRPPSVVKKVTVLTISPASFTLKPDETVTLTATLKDADGNILTGKPITWSLDGPGTLSTTTGASVTYKAPEEVTEKITVRITATFAGDEDYVGSTATSMGEITPVTVVAEEYVLTFDEASLKNAKIEGPATIGGIKVARVTADALEVTGFNLSRIGLTALNVNITTLEMYATNFTAYSPELGKTLKVSGGETVSLTYETITFENAVIRMVRMSAETGEFKEMEVVGEYVGGAEPYIPTILSVPKVVISEGYALTGPYTYRELKDAALLFEMGIAEMSDLSLTHPIEYSLDRFANKFTSVNKWVAAASKATITNASVYNIFLHFNAYGLLSPSLTGEDSPESELHMYSVGLGGTITDASIHVIYAKMDHVVVEDFVVEILSS